MSTTTTPSLPRAARPGVSLADDPMSVALSTLPADPSLTFNIYADGLLDDLMLRLIRPFHRHLSRQARPSLFWTVRYSRRGEHLKVRLHLEASEIRHARELFESSAADYFRGIEDLPHPVERSHFDEVPAIDPEDGIDGLAADRSILPTRYQRGFVNLGGEPLLSLDEYATRTAQCLSAGLNLIMDATEGITEAPSPWLPADAWRQKMLLKAVLIGTHSTGWGCRSTLRKYSEFHRDCLLQFYIAHLDEEQATRDVFSRQAMKSPVAPLRAIADAEAARNPDDDDDDPTTSWRRAIEGLCRYLEPFDGDPTFLTHPLAEHVAWPPMFKVFHGLANQLGLPPFKEAFIHHLITEILADGVSANAAQGDSR